MLPMKQDPFVDAFAQYLDAVQEATCDRILERELTNPGKLKGSGKKLVEAAAPKVKGSAEKLSILVDVLESQGQLASGDFWEMKEVADTLRKFGPHLEKNYGLTLYAGIDSNSDGTAYLEVCLGKAVTVAMGPLRSTIFAKNVVGRTDNRLWMKMNSKERCVGWVNGDGIIYHDFEAITERAMTDWKVLGGFDKDESDHSEATLRKLAYGTLFEKFRHDSTAFAREVAFDHVKNTATHEFHHNKIVREADACRQIREACAYLYTLSKAHEPETLFDGLYSIYVIRHAEDERYRSASMLALDYLRKAGYSEDNWSSLEPGGTGETSVMISRQAKEALKLIESECSLRKHEDVEALLKPDFDGYGTAVRNAVTSALSEER